MTLFCIIAPLDRFETSKQNKQSDKKMQSGAEDLRLYEQPAEQTAWWRRIEGEESGDLVEGVECLGCED
jgi:hypothetical protein